MGDEDDRLAQLAEDAHELHLEVGARDGVERPQRLVEQEDRGIQHQRPHEAHALPLSTAQLVRIAFHQLGLEVHQRGEGVEPCCLTRSSPARGARRQHDVARGREVRIQGAFLDDVAHGRDRLHAHVTPVGMEETEDEAQDRRFSGPAGAEQDVHRPGLDRERDVIEGDAVAEPLGDVAKRDHRGAARRGSALVSGRCRAPSARPSAGSGRASRPPRGAPAAPSRSPASVAARRIPRAAGASG